MDPRSASPPPPIRILCVEDHKLVLEGITLIIGREPDMRVVATATQGEDSIALYQQHRPDVTLMDLQLGAVTGLDAIRAIRRSDPAARIIVLTMSQADEDIHRALEAGAATYLLKDSMSGELIRTIRQVGRGQDVDIRPDLQARLAERAASPPLSTRQIQVVELMSIGMRNKEIAAVLGISDETVQVHVKKILTKLGVHDRTAAVHIALRRGIIHIS